MSEMIEGHCIDDGMYNKPCSGEITLDPCPYMEEIHNHIEMVWLCETHRGERARDV